MTAEIERHAPLTSACNVVKQYPDSNIEHVCRLDHIGSDVHSCTCGLVWWDTSRDEELEQLRAERDALKAELATAYLRVNELSKKEDREYRRAEKAVGELAEARAAIECGQVARFAADVQRLIAGYSDAERDVVALMPFAATFDQLCLERYGIDLDKVAALDAPQRPEDTREETGRG